MLKQRTPLKRTPLKPRREALRRTGLPTSPAKLRRPLRKKSQTVRIKPRRQEDPEHLARLRRFGCWCCRVDGLGWVYADAHHPKVKGGAGAGQKAPDREAIPLCPERHHNVNVPGFISIHYHPIEWRARYGAEAEVCAQVNKAMENEVEQ